MIKEAIEKLLELSAPIIIDRDNIGNFSNKQIHLIKPPYCDSLITNTLQSIPDYLGEETDDGAGDIIHIESPWCVHLYSHLDYTKGRNEFLRAQCQASKFPFGQFLYLESFIINFQACFEDTEAKAKILQLVGTVKDEDIKIHEDDGVTQRVTASAGVGKLEYIDAPNPVILKPFRTFPEIDQPESKFIFRLRKNVSGIEAGFWPADGDRWELEAIEKIKKWLLEKDLLSEMIILS